jgi:nucleoid-associated protein YgaU
MPSFDVLRVEPSGDAVIAGVAEPGALVEVLDAGKPVATAKANEAGDWALALDHPLSPGTHDLSIRTTTADRSSVMLSDQRVAVAVPEKPTEEPLVVLNTPDAASRIIEMPKPAPGKAAKRGEAGKTPAASEVAGASPSETAAEANPAQKSSEGAKKPPLLAEGAPAGEKDRTKLAADAAPQAAPGAAVAGTPNGAPVAQDASEAASLPLKGKPAKPAVGKAAGAPALPAGSEGRAAPPPGGNAGPAAAGGGPAAPKPGDRNTPAAVAEAGGAGADSGPAVAGDKPARRDAAAATAKPAVPKIIPKVAVTAVEADTAGSLFVAGTAATRDPIRVYLDGALLGETKPTEGGTWLIEVHRELAAGTYKIRADQLDPASGEVMIGAEVPFQREIEVASLKMVGEAGGPGGASATGAIPDPQTVIVKRFDNLWQISRRMYGNGTRWSTIYVANKEQIRKPRWIFPGQVFTVPAGDASWKD